MKKYMRLDITTQDRVGMAYKVLEVFYKNNVSIESLEVFPNKCCVKFKRVDNKIMNVLLDDLHGVNGIFAIDKIKLLNYEINEKKLFATIDSVDKGIIAVNKNFKIEIFNYYCEEYFDKKKEEILGQDIRRLFWDKPDIIELIEKGQEFENVKLKIKNDKGENLYLVSLKAINDDDNKNHGFVISIKDFDNAIKIANVVLQSGEGAFREIIGNSPKIENVKKMIFAVAKSNSTILLRGESGTGKELFAKAIYKLSDRSNKKFVILNCAALPDSLIESELFGFEKGSFTGALTHKEGLFKVANGGTLFLDEVGELSMAMQAKLLRVLQDGTIRKIGGIEEEKVDVRIIAATNRDLEKMVAANEFRRDLYYRLNVIPIYIPALKERIEDIPHLVNYFINEFNIKLGKNIKYADPEFINELMNYNWKGNVRELKNIIERSMLLCRGSILKRDDIIVNYENGMNFKKHKLSFNRGDKLRDIIERVERQVIKDVLHESKSIRRAAKKLGVSHTTIINKINKYSLDKCKE
ncbi:sigma 54-interacting transcriptional regulator [Paramaledivibacter caminithermalis]|nr:sigma 54-interacting transcriptional regulator [Paramaledivibacter caminithermalis]